MKKGGNYHEKTKPVVDTVQGSVQKYFQELMAKKKFNENDVEEGRLFVKTYVTFTHYVERIYESAKSPSEGHGEAETEGVHK